MQPLYNAAMRIAKAVFRLAWKACPEWMLSHDSKTYQFFAGQQDCLKAIHEALAGNMKEVYWVHAVSLGEYGVARPILKRLQAENRCVVLTFFSPTGYLALHSKRNTGADHIFYLPWDTARNVRDFLDTVNPRCAVFIISEYWLNYLSELRRRQIPTFMVSALVPGNTYLKRWYMRPMRHALKAVTTFMVLNEESQQTLASMGFQNSTVMGDPLFDNALSIAQTPYENPIIEKFCQSANGVFIAGSISDKNDLELVSQLANSQKDTKFIFVPHEISEHTLLAYKASLHGCSVNYSECTPDTDFSQTQVLIINYVGDLARIYRYGRWAYVGGGFTPLLHSVVEPMVYGLPVAFGPRIERKVTPLQMVNLGIGCVVETSQALQEWFLQLKDNRVLQESISRKAIDYAQSHAGATEAIVNTITQQEKR